MISIDPGTKALGAALWVSGKIASAWLVIPEGRTLQEKIDSLPRPGILEAEAVCERMDAGGMRVPANDLINVATVGAVYAAKLGERVVFVKPGTWKGRVPKKIHHKRIRRALSDDETQVLDKALDKCPRKEYRKELMDAVGIGLWRLGRKV